MSQPTEQYRSIDLGSKTRKQAFRVWLIGLAIVFVWTALIVVAPAALSGGFPAFASPIYHFFGYACHQFGERSFHLGGEPFAVCSRCFGVYFGLLTGFAIYPLWRNITDIEPLPRFWLFLSLIPITIDWSLTMFGVWENTHLSRFLTGLILGMACATFIIPALVEVTRRLTMSNRPRLAS
jgi:uncharacterized membrane protein